MWSERTEQGIFAAGIGVILVLIGSLFLYQRHVDAKNVIPQSEWQAKADEFSVEGYEEEEDLIAYMLWQIQEKNLDYALRGCAVQDLAKYFSMTYYIEYTEQYPDLNLIPPADYGSSAYEAISVSRLSRDYAVKLENAFQMLSKYGNLKLVDAVEDVPENPDGKYYERQDKICEILGSRSIREMLITVQTDQGAIKMRWTLARYKRFWKLLLFNPLEQYQSADMDISVGSEDKMELLDSNVNESDVIACNYYFVNDCSEENPEELVNRFLLYIQKQDVWSAMTYYKLYDHEPAVDMEYFGRQNQAAVEIQNLFYRMFMPDENMKAWYLRDMEERAVQLVEELSTAQIVYAKFANFEILENSEDKIKCHIMYGYNNRYEWITFNLVYSNGWKIERIE